MPVSKKGSHSDALAGTDRVWFCIIAASFWPVTVMLVTSWCWWLTVNDNFRMLATELRSWYPTLMLRDRGCWWPKWPKPSPTSKNCHQHISSPTSVTNIDVARELNQFHFKRWNLKAIYVAFPISITLFPTF